MKESGLSGSALLADRGRAVLRDAVSGLVGSVVLIANIVSFAALMFPGALAQGASTAIWAMLLGSGVTGAWVAWKTSLPPMATGIDSPTGAVLVLLAASCGSAVLSAGGSPQQVVQATLLLFFAATVATGVLLLGLGAARWGHLLRFVPYFVVAGFLAATGWLLIAGGVRMTTGLGPSDLLAAAWTAPQAAKLACAVLTLAVLLALRRWVASALALPGALLAMTVAGTLTLKLLGLAAPEHGWYLPSLGALTSWSVFDALRAAPMSASMALAFLPEVVAVAMVALVSLVTKTSALELARKTSGDLDAELRAHGVVTLAVAPFGGIVASMQLGSSRLLEHAGAATRWSGAAAAFVLLVAGLAGFDLPALIPLPIAAGLVFYLGYSFLLEALAKPLAQRAWVNLLLALAIAAACVRYGYLAGVLGGIVGACLLFALSYARTGAVRQHLSRAQFAGNVSRSAAASRHLGEVGESIQIYWLAGYVFFGSSEGVFERVRDDLRARPPRQVSHVVLDLGMVTGADVSASISLVKLRNHCRQLGAVLLFSSIPHDIARELGREGLLGREDQPPPFADVNDALAWCEERVLARTGLLDVDAGGFEAWLQQQLGPQLRAADFVAYLDRHEVVGSQVLYREGDPSDDIDLVAAGRLVVDIGSGTGHAMRVRSITTHTVVGEMGFVRRTARSATVSSEGDATVFVLTRAHFERMRRERPDLAIAFYEFLMRTVADRIGLSERMALALGGRAAS